MDAHTVLGVDRDATLAEIKAAYRAQAMRLHPDRHMGADPERAQEAFVRLNKAFRAAVAGVSVAAAARPVGPVLPAQRRGEPPVGSPHVAGYVPTQPWRRPAPSPRLPHAGGTSRPVSPRRSPGTAYAAGSRPARPAVIPAQQRTHVPARDQDPMLALLTLPMRCREGWTDEQLSHWALVMTPAARKHVEAGRRAAVEAGAGTVEEQTMAAAHAILTLTMTGRVGRQSSLLADRLPVAYDALESALPLRVRDRLPQRVIVPGKKPRGIWWR